VKTDIEFMDEAIVQAKHASKQGEVPVGAVVVLNGEIIGRGFNTMLASHDPSGHAEIQAIRQAARSMGNYRLTGTEVFVTLEPCNMCAGAMVHARIERLVFAAREPKAGVIVSNAEFFKQSYLNHRVKVSDGVREDICSTLLKTFFVARRKASKKITRFPT